MFERQLNAVLRSRLNEPRKSLQVLQGPRQVGKTTSVRQVLGSLAMPSVYASADLPEMQDRRWIATKWNEARALCARTGDPVVLALDEVQKVPRWSESVKALYDEDTWKGRDVRVVLLGSSPLLLGRGVRETMAGRFEIIRAGHWIWPEMREAFGWDLDTFIYFGGHPGSASYIGDEQRWKDYVRETVVETTLSRDLLHMTRVEKPAALRRLMYMAAEYSGRELSYRKMMGGLDDVGNATTVAHYLQLLSDAGLATGLHKYAGQPVRMRATTPKLQVHSNSLVSALGSRSFCEAKADREWWGRLVESCVGAHLLSVLNEAQLGQLAYWRDRSAEVDFVVAGGRNLIAIEVKSGASRGSTRGIDAFNDRFGGNVVSLVVGTGGIPLADFLESKWVSLEAARGWLSGINTDVEREPDRV